ncbi:Partitioning defective 3 [Orchesella cincta]|uniref:Partitioning defective 3 n=1 Tax=Orchesella cincta TaxID=48709 RepID=A0A1D2NJR1_ORCCI|nr:Partitioning defective 3 [Orchesella cincta]
MRCMGRVDRVMYVNGRGNEKGGSGGQIVYKNGPESWVVVHKLKSQSDGGILDPDDKLVDVADDREQIMAIYEEDNDGMPSLQHNAGDGTSASSVGTNSPDIFQKDSYVDFVLFVQQGSDHKFQPFARTDIEITGEELSNGVGGSGSANSGGLTLQVRRGSEPALNRLSPVQLSPPDPSKRWSAAPKIDEDKDDRKEYVGSGDQDRVNASALSENSVVSVSVGDSSRPTTNGGVESGLYQKHGKYGGNNSTAHGTGSGGVHAQIQQRSHSGNSSKYGTISTSEVERREGGNRFSRDHHRLSMQFVGDAGYKWADAADRALSLSLRKEPLGANATPDTPLENLAPQHFSTPNTEHPPTDLLNGNILDLDAEKRLVEIIMRHEAGPLGIHVVPEHNADGRNQGLIVQSVEPGGRVDRDGRVQAQDKIIEINGQYLVGVQFQKAQELFRESLKSAELRLKVIKHQLNYNPLSDLYSEESEKENMIEGHEKIVGDSKVATVSQTKKLPLQSATLPRPGAVTTNIITSNTRKIGRKYEIDLQKGPQGLGFSITTRDNPAGGNCPIYIKNILPTGAAIEDGRLRPGDRLLEVNGIEITGKTQGEAVSILRNIPQGGIVKLVVSRQERIDLSPKLPRQIPPDKIEDDSQPSPWSEREVLTLDIPVLDTEKAGLGISVKGKTNAVRGKMMDMGIFIKSVIHGGAASRDGRLKSNDQLLNINGVSLLNRSNTDAMETLRRTMTQDGPKPKPGFITLTIARRVPSSSAPTTDLSGGGSSASGDETDSWSKNISISVDGSRTDDKSVTIESLNRSLDSSAHNGDGNAIFVQQLPNESPKRGSTSSSSRQSYHVRSSSLRRVDDRSSTKLETEAKVRHRSPPPYVNKVVDLPRNPVLDRLTGKTSSNPSRNESYYKATNDTWNGAFLQSVMPSRSELESGGMSPNQSTSVTVHNARGEMVLVEDDYVAPQKPPRRSRSSTPVDGLESGVVVAPKSGNSRVSTPVNSLTNGNNNGQPPSDTTYASQTSLEDLGGFSRDAFGRQSMSEKRHATLDAKSTDTYQRNKKLRDERQRQKAHEESHAEQLARERNMQDQLARRGIKRPFSSSTEDDLALRSTSQTNGVTLGHQKGQPPALPNTCQRFSKYSVIGKRGDRLGLGDQLLQLLQQWGNRQSGLLLQCYDACSSACSQKITKTPRTDVVGLPRVNSADSLVDALKGPQTTTPASKGKKSKGSSGYKKDIGPSLGMKKSSSLESLQTMVQEIQVQEDTKSGYVPQRSGPSTVRVVRGRGCNESFRQAVDRSYEAPLGEQMETFWVAEEETESCLSGATYGRKSGDLGDAEEQYGKTKGAKKKQGIFRGLGSMFRFGRHRKSIGASSAMARAQHEEAVRLQEELLESQEKEKQWHLARNEEIRNQQEQARKHQDYVQSVRGTGNYAQTYIYSQHPQQQPTPQASNTMRVPIPQISSGNNTIRSSRKSEGTRGDKDINGNTNPVHGRSTSFDVYNEMTRPGSRVGIVDPKKYTHYINYEEIRHHLNRRHQQHYHSQRREHPRERQERPVSNFYEYESVQAAMHAAAAASQSPPGNVLQQHGQHQNQHHNSMQPPGLVLHGQPIYGMSSSQLQQNRLNNNNGITLPSPSGPFTVGMHQTSPSQFQQQQPPQQRPKPNSLPRRSHKGDPGMISLMQSTVSPGQQLPQHFHLSHSGSSGRYSMHFPHSHQHSSYVQIPEQSATSNSTSAGYRSVSQTMNTRAPSGSMLHHHQIQTHHQSHHHQQHSTPSTNVGSKV